MDSAASDAGVLDLSDKAPSRLPSRTLFLNFDAVTLTQSEPGKPVDGTKNVAWFKDGTCGQYAKLPALTKTCATNADCPQGGTCSWVFRGNDGIVAKRCNKRDYAYEAEVLEGTRQGLAPYNVRVVSHRPVSSPYDMVVFTMNVACNTGGPGGSAPQGCGMPYGNNVFYAQQSRRWNWTPFGLSHFVLHEFGHTFGLYHDEKPGPMGIDVSFDRKQPQRYYNGCAPTGPANTCSINQEICGRALQQNSHRLMLRVLGPAPAGGVWHGDGWCGGKRC